MLVSSPPVEQPPCGLLCLPEPGLRAPPLATQLSFCPLCRTLPLAPAGPVSRAAITGSRDHSPAPGPAQRGVSVPQPCPQLPAHQPAEVTSTHGLRAAGSSVSCLLCLSKKKTWRRQWPPLQHSCLENPTDGGAWWAAVHGLQKSDTTEGIHFLSFYGSFWRRKWQSTPVFLPGESHGRRDLVGYGLWGCKESDTTKQLTHTHTHTHTRRKPGVHACVSPALSTVGV